MNLAQIGNLLEAMVWLTIGAILFVKSIRAGPQSRLLQILAVTFTIFGLTDIIEIQSGAWWRPTWLLAIKAICVLSFVISLISYLRAKSHRAKIETPPS